MSSPSVEALSAGLTVVRPRMDAVGLAIHARPELQAYSHRLREAAQGAVPQAVADLARPRGRDRLPGRKSHHPSVLRRRRAEAAGLLRRPSVDAAHDMGEPAPAHDGTVLEVSALSGRPGICVSGDISVVTRLSWEQALAELTRRHTDVSYVELSGVGFVDVAGVSALAVTAMNLPSGRVVVEHPPPQVPRVLELFWPTLRGIEVAPR